LDRGHFQPKVSSSTARCPVVARFACPCGVRRVLAGALVSAICCTCSFSNSLYYYYRRFAEKVSL